MEKIVFEKFPEKNKTISFKFSAKKRRILILAIVIILMILFIFSSFLNEWVVNNFYN